jgi:pimeloyl-ACP methyl ester carboxylesterase
LFCAAKAASADGPPLPNLKEGDFVIKNYVFRSGETLPELKFHCRTFDTPKTDAAGRIVNAVLLLPHYCYHDIVDSEHRLITAGLGIKHLRLVIGRSMGGMQTWMWGEMYPDLMDGVVPLASQPAEISGRNWIMRRAAIEAIKHDPDWKDGYYDEQPTHYIYSAPVEAVMTENVVRTQERAPNPRDR